jgi:hypothetical protein
MTAIEWEYCATDEFDAKWTFQLLASGELRISVDDEHHTVPEDAVRRLIDTYSSVLLK